jgi:hypothetical protein
MPFPKDFPKEALHALMTVKEQDQSHIVLAAYELLGYGLHFYYGDVMWLAGLDFDTLSKFAEGADLAAKIQTRARELKGSGVGVFLIIMKLLAEFGPVILKLAQAIRELFKKES